MKLAKCPYCGKRISYFSAFSLRRRGEYFCNKCKKESNVHIKKTIFLPIAAAVILSLMILMVFLLLTDRKNLWFMLLVAVPYLIFYLISPLFVQLRPKKKHLDALYDTQMVEAPKADPDPTMEKASKVVPTFVDDVILEDEDYKPNISADVFNAIKEERKIVAETDGGTRAFDKFENISSSQPLDATRPVENIRNIEIDTDAYDSSYRLENFE